MTTRMTYDDAKRKERMIKKDKNDKVFSEDGNKVIATGSRAVWSTAL